MKAYVLGAVMGIASIYTAVAAENPKLVDVRGDVLVNTGSGFLPINGVAAMRPGDRVYVKKGGAASIDYGQGCLVNLVAGTSSTVSSETPCIGSTSQAGATNNMGMYVIGGILVAGGVGVLISALDDDNDNGRVPVTGTR